MIIWHKMKNSLAVIFYTGFCTGSTHTHTQQTHPAFWLQNFSRGKNVTCKCKNLWVASNGKILLFMFEKNEWLTRVCYIRLWNNAKNQIFYKYSKLRNNWILPKKINKNFKFTFQHDGTLCHIFAVIPKFLKIEFLNKFVIRKLDLLLPNLDPLHCSIWNKFVKKISKDFHRKMESHW